MIHQAADAMMTMAGVRTCLEVLGGKVLWKQLLGEDVRREQDQQASAPFHHAGILLGANHVMQTANKLVEPWTAAVLTVCRL